MVFFKKFGGHLKIPSAIVLAFYVCGSVHFTVQASHW